MKLGRITGFRRVIFLAITASLVPLAGVLAATESDNAPLSAPAGSFAGTLSGPAREVLKMTASGVQEGVIKAYVENAPSMFNLSADNIINLQGVGVTPAVMTAMLSRDKVLRDNALLSASTMAPQQPQTMMPASPYPVNPADVAAPTDQPYYTGLQSYGDWNYVPDYGWGWQPDATLAYGAYPWGLLDGGYWFNLPGRGYCWFPGRRFNGFNRYSAYNRFAAAYNPARSAAFRGFNRSFAVGRSFGVTRGFSPGVSHFGGGSFGGAHFGGGVSHFSGGHSGGGTGHGHR